MIGRMFSREHRFLMRTVLISDQFGGLEAGIKNLETILKEDGIFRTIKNQRYHEKPSMLRNRLNHERSKRIYTHEMHRKVSLLMMKNRQDPYLV